MTGTSVQIELSGPFFTRDPGETLRQNIERMMEGLAQEGERTAREAFISTEGGRAPLAELGDKSSAHVVGRTVSVYGKQWRAAAVVSIRNTGFSAEQAQSLMAGASQAERETHVMRNLARTIRSARAVLNANLSAGIE